MSSPLPHHPLSAPAFPAAQTAPLHPQPAPSATTATHPSAPVSDMASPEVAIASSSIVEVPDADTATSLTLAAHPMRNRSHPQPADTELLSEDNLTFSDERKRKFNNCPRCPFIYSYLHNCKPSLHIALSWFFWRATTHEAETAARSHDLVETARFRCTSMTISCTSPKLPPGDVEHSRRGDGAAVDGRAEGRIRRHVHGGTTGLMERTVLYLGKPLNRVYWCSMTIITCAKSSIDGGRTLESTPCTDLQHFSTW